MEKKILCMVTQRLEVNECNSVEILVKRVKCTIIDQQVS